MNESPLPVLPIYRFYHFCAPVGFTALPFFSAVPVFATRQSASQGIGELTYRQIKNRRIHESANRRINYRINESLNDATNEWANQRTSRRGHECANRTYRFSSSSSFYFLSSICRWFFLPTESDAQYGHLQRGHCQICSNSFVGHYLTLLAG